MGCCLHGQRSYQVNPLPGTSNADVQVRQQVQGIIKPLTPDLAMAAKKVPARMFAVQHQLPRLPVPELQQTMDKYLRVVQPLIPEEEFNQTKQLVSEFAKEGGLGEELQRHLQLRAKKHLSWLSEWWVNVAYLQSRLPVVINSNPAVVLPHQDFNCKDDQIHFAARIISGILDYKIMIDDQTLPVEQMGGQPLCMMQFYKILGSCRIPGEKTDSFVNFPPDKPDPPKHILVSHNNHFFRMDVYGKDGKPLSQNQLEQQLHRIVDDSGKVAPPVGILTTENRSSWAKSYKRLSKDKGNRAVFHEIQHSVMMLCLDKTIPVPEGDDQVSHNAKQMLHGLGSHGNSGNRWFDKTLQVIVGEDGACGLSYEHAPAEGPPIISLLDFIYSHMNSNEGIRPGTDTLIEPKRLDFKLTPQVLDDIEQAKEHIDSMAQDVQMTGYTFNGYGKNFPKSQKMSPDAYIQMAFQLSYYRLYNRTCATYESGSLRRFQLGRTDTIRSCSNESLAFCEAMMDDSVDAQQRAKLLRLAVDQHRQYTNETVNGQGIDRHLLGLKLTAIEQGLDVPELFMDTTYSRAMHYNLSTSQVPSKIDVFMCFGPVVPDGYGLCYNPHDARILFGISAFNSSPETDSRRFRDSLERSLTDMHDILVKASAKSKL